METLFYSGLQRASIRVTQSSTSLPSQILNMKTGSHFLIDQEDTRRRFSGIAHVYGEAGLKRLRNAHVCVIGVGGVGSWAVEALVRSAVGAITLIDMDVIVESNINRQIHSLDSTLGLNKADAMAERARSINPDISVRVVDDFITVENVAELVSGRYDHVIDGIDNFRAKAALVNHCVGTGIEVVTIGGAGGQVNPLLIRLADLCRSEHDPLLAQTRKLLRQKYGFSRNPETRFEVACVYSSEKQVYPTPEGGVSSTRPAGLEGGDLSCAGGLGSVTTVTASFGLVAVSHVLGKIAAGTVSG
jgi:tRNA A37 threonylcarbamoyladenosine dehydratase